MCTDVFSALPFRHVTDLFEAMVRVKKQQFKHKFLDQFRVKYVDPHRRTASDLYQLYRLLCPAVSVRADTTRQISWANHRALRGKMPVACCCSVRSCRSFADA